MDLKRKLTSRKFWLAVIGFITPLLTAFNVSESDITQITAIIMAGATLMAYILAEGFTDAFGGPIESEPVDLGDLIGDIEEAGDE